MVTVSEADFFASLAENAFISFSKVVKKAEIFSFPDSYSLLLIICVAFCKSPAATASKDASSKNLNYFLPVQHKIGY